MTCEVLPMTRHLVMLHRQATEGLIDRAMSRGLRLFAVSDVIDRINDGRWQGWGVFRDGEMVALCVTCVDQYPLGRLFNIMLMAGDYMPEWLDKIENIEQWASNQGCTVSQIYGRRGWSRLLPRYKHERDVLRAAL